MLHIDLTIISSTKENMSTSIVNSTEQKIQEKEAINLKTSQTYEIC